MRITALSLATLVSILTFRAVAAPPMVPQALDWSRGSLYVGARDGSLLEINPSDWSVAKRTRLDVGIASLRRLKSGAIAAGGVNGELLFLDRAGRCERRVSIGRGEVNFAILGDDSVLAVSRWGRRAAIVECAGGRVRAEFRIEAALGKVVGLPDGRALAFDAFGGGVHRIDPRRADGVESFEIDAVNVLGATLSGDKREVLFGHMSQYSPIAITKTNIDWGLVLSARLSSIRLSELNEAHPGDRLRRRGVALDGSKHGAADPSGVAVSADGKLVAVAAAGSNQILLVDRTLGPKDYSSPELPLGNSLHIDVVPVGKSPVEVAFDPNGRFVACVDAMSDTLSVIDLGSMKLIKTKTLCETQPTLTAVDRGERRFRDARKSFDAWMSCASCHVLGHTNGLNYDTSADGGYGSAKNTPSLLGVAQTAPYSWLGKFSTLEEQVRSSMETTLHGPAAEATDIVEVADYLRSIESPPAKRDTSDPDAVRGLSLFRERKCDSCHQGPTYQSATVRDVGIHDDSGGYRRFNPPSLRGVGWSAPYFHDGRARTLSDALKLHHPGTANPPTSEDERYLKAFLESL